ncbi:polysaccharide biosynthesis C-terminal domain-containing protein [Sporolactobacillus sp. STCC-11]|uniref:oligosaccharide flippase family protein n=1 Tax=Sporolactobacillus caesalpiniae TaxID=3230362 RepID=UPI003393C817
MIFLNIIHQYTLIFLIQSILIISAAVDISWLYMGLEDFKKTVLRNLIVKVIGVLCIFIFVKTSRDIWHYVLILSASELFGQLTLWMYLPKVVKKIKLNWHDIVIHFKPALGLFIPQIAIQIYIVLNKTMLGILSNVNEVGYFENADKIVKVILAVVTAMGVVMLPRISNTFAKGDTNKVKEYLYKSFGFASFLSIPLMFGIASISENFTPWFFGPSFNKTGIIIVMLSPIIVFIAWSNVLGVQYLMPIGKVRSYTISVICGAGINFVLNLLLIPHFQSLGTAIATLIAELIVTLYQFICIVKETKIKYLFSETWKYITGGFMMYFINQVIGYLMPINPLTTLVQIIVGVLIYFSILIVLKSQVNKQMINKVVSLIKIKKQS